MSELVGLAVTLLLASTPERTAPEIRQTTAFYDVAGSNAERLREALDRARPVGPDGRRVDAFASWKVHYTYQTVVRDGACRLRRLTVTADIATTLPRWVDRPAVTSELTGRWDRYLASLASNLSGIQEIGKRAAARLHESIWRLAEQPDCEKLDDAIGATADAVIQQHLRENEEYNKTLQDDPAKAARFP